MNGDEIPVGSLKAQGVRELVGSALHCRNSAGAIDEFVGRVDWSQPERAHEAVRDLVGKLEGLTHALSEGDLSVEADRRELEAIASINVR